MSEARAERAATAAEVRAMSEALRRVLDARD